MVIVYSLYLVSVLEDTKMNKDTKNSIVIIASFVSIVGNSCYYIAHWIFALKYYLVSKLMKNLNQDGPPFNAKKYERVKILLCTLIIINVTAAYWLRASW